MHSREAVNRLRLGPVVGHTDDHSLLVWIRVFDDPALYALRVQGAGIWPFVSTEVGGPEFGTAIAVADGLRPDRLYRYEVLRRGRSVPGARGRVQTAPLPGSMAEISFLAVSCSDQMDEGAWPALADFVERSKPRFLVMMGDQVYMDQEPNLWQRFLDGRRRTLREDMAEKYQQAWSRPAVREVLKNVPTYMVWDDHDIRDGWGSWAPDSPTLRARYSAGESICADYNEYFEDARDVYWHFQMCRNPLSVTGPPTPGERGAMPFAFRWGRLVVLVVDSRGDRDLWRESRPVLGESQWQYIEDVLQSLEPTDDALAVVTPAPIATMSPTGQVQHLLGHRTDDVELLKEGDAAGLRELQGSGDKGFGELVLSAFGGWAANTLGIGNEIGSFKLGDIDDARDQWSHRTSRTEQEALIKAAVGAMRTNRLADMPRGLTFVGGDLHSGGLFDIETDSSPSAVPLLVSSGIGRRNDPSDPLLHTVMDESFDVAPGIKATMRTMVNDYNFGVVQVVPTGATPIIEPAVAHAGNSWAWGLRVKVGP